MLNKNTEEKINSYYMDIIVVCITLLVLATMYYGAYIIYMAVVVVSVGCLTEYLLLKLGKREIKNILLPSSSTALLIVLMLSPGAPVWLGIFAVLFAQIVARYPFGNGTHYIFNPAVVGMAFVTLTWSGSLFSYPIKIGQIVGSQLENVPGITPGAMLKIGGVPTELPMLDVLVGNFPGAIGATPIIVLLACATFLFIRKSWRGEIALSFVAACAVIALVLPRTTADMWSNLFFELTSGMLLLAVILLMADPNTVPSSKKAGIMYGVVAGIFTMVFRYVGVFEEGVLFALILTTAMSPIFEDFSAKYNVSNFSSRIPKFRVKRRKGKEVAE